VLVETVLAFALASSCDVTKAALGGCGSVCSSNTPGSFSLCDSQTTERTESSGAINAKPKRLCTFYANGTIDIPTMTVISAWIDIGSRLCIGDPIPEPAPPRTITEELSDIFTANLDRPAARLLSRQRPETYESVVFEVDADSKTVAGKLLGDPATIRFRPVATMWVFSDGDSARGNNVSKFFSQQGTVWGKARVTYEVDYNRFGSWVMDAASWTLTSNTVDLQVFDPPRKTLLVP
jgi:hypothetical protein